jgi:hypothetical protein
LHEINLAARRALEVELIDIIKLYMFYLHHDLTGVSNDLGYLIAHCLLEGRWKEDKLHLVLELSKWGNKMIKL